MAATDSDVKSRPNWLASLMYPPIASDEADQALKELIDDIENLDRSKGFRGLIIYIKALAQEMALKVMEAETIDDLRNYNAAMNSVKDVLDIIENARETHAKLIKEFKDAQTAQTSRKKKGLR